MVTTVRAETEVPRNTTVEQRVLSAMIQSDAARLTGLATLDPGCFWQLSYQHIFAAIKALVDGDVSVDLTTIGHQLERRENQLPVITALELADIAMSAVGDHGFKSHCDILRELRQRRTLIETAKTINLLAADTSVPLDTARSLVEQALDAQPTAGTGLISLDDALADTLTAVMEAQKVPGGSVGLTTGIEALDSRLYSLPPSSLILVAARPSVGKCLGRGTKVIMYSGGLKAVEDVQPDDLLMGPDSRPRRVRGLGRGREMMYWVRQEYGIDYRANEDHILSLKRSKNEGSHRHGDVRNVTVRDWLAMGPGARARYKGYKVAIDYPERDLPIDPYLLGLWLGDGSARSSKITNVDQEIILDTTAFQAALDYLRDFADAQWLIVREYKDKRTGVSTWNICRPQRGGSPADKGDSLQGKLRSIGVLGNKHIPGIYLHNSKKNRRLLLAGLIDSDGSRNEHGLYEITLKNEALARQIKFLCDSLGYRTSLTPKKAKAQTGPARTYYRLHFNGNVDALPVLIKRKKPLAWKGNRDWTMTGISVEPDCVDDYFGFELDGDGLFLLEDGTVTHNTALATQIAAHVAARHAEKGTVLFFSVEMSREDMSLRLMSQQARIEFHRLRLGALRDDEWQHVTREASKLSTLPIHIDDDGDITVSQLRARARAFAKKKTVSLVIVDYLQLVGGSDKAKNREQEIATVSRGLKAMSKQLRCPVIALSQMNRAIELRQTKMPQLSDLRESGSLEQDADVILFLNNTFGDEENRIEAVIAKSRNGPKGNFELAYERRFFTFGNGPGFRPQAEVKAHWQETVEEAKDLFRAVV